ncbi:ABC transporter permease [Modestobacter sp. KNN46-3]|uniref:ABC transporter permease n=1 Tax=Modestobacter sp. KNN46-3 TaxID=2711218 RepID=UPI001F14D472|nr:ABC transporter permease subunit [Modestobacter sp. KNN46-3]
MTGLPLAAPGRRTHTAGPLHTGRSRRSPRRRALLLILPAVVPTGAVVLAALTSALLSSLGLTPLVGQPRLTLDPWRAPTDHLWTAAGLSVAIATAATVLAALVGLATALAITGRRRSGRLLALLSSATIPVPHVVGAAAVGLLLADAGFLPRLLGVETGWPPLVGGRWWIAVVAEYAWKESAFIALVVSSALASRVASYRDTAIVLGARPWARLRYVTLPLAAPALVASAGISFVYVLGSYEVAWLLGRPSPEPLPVLAFRLFTSLELTARPEAATVAVATAALALAAVAVAAAALRRMEGWR